MILPKKQYSRAEIFLNAIATNNTDNLPKPQSRMEIYLDYIAKNSSSGGIDLTPISTEEIDKIFNIEFKNGINPNRGLDIAVIPELEEEEEWR